MFGQITAHNINLVEALKAANLPTSDLGKPNQSFWCLTEQGKAVGYYGLEAYSGHALLRSLVVDPAFQGRGYGAELVIHAVETAKSQGIESLWLLTKTAKAFFEHLGWTPVERRRAPASIAQCEEFIALCPASADCLTLLVQEKSGLKT